MLHTPLRHVPNGCLRAPVSAKAGMTQPGMTFMRSRGLSRSRVGKPRHAQAPFPLDVCQSPQCRSSTTHSSTIPDRLFSGCDLEKKTSDFEGTASFPPSISSSPKRVWKDMVFMVMKLDKFVEMTSGVFERSSEASARYWLWNVWLPFWHYGSVCVWTVRC